MTEASVSVDAAKDDLRLNNIVVVVVCCVELVAVMLLELEDASVCEMKCAPHIVSQYIYYSPMKQGYSIAYFDTQLESTKSDDIIDIRSPAPRSKHRLRLTFWLTAKLRYHYRSGTAESRARRQLEYPLPLRLSQSESPIRRPSGSINCSQA